MIKNNQYYLLFFLIILFYNCNDKKDSKSLYPLHVGDIPFNKALDSADFFICNENRIPQYYAFNESPYKEEKIDLINYFSNNYNGENFEKENGFISIRFIINCNGESGRFRIQEMDMDMNEKTFNSELSTKILSLTKAYKGWNNIIHKKQPYDYYNYLTFKIIDSEIEEILP